MKAPLLRGFRLSGPDAAGAEIGPLLNVCSTNAARTALAIAIENGVEGCVRETFGALVAHHQAMAAGDGAIGRMMRVIAEDETRHAELAWSVAGWLEPRLSPEARAAVHAARTRAIEELRRELESEPDPSLRDLAGMPDRRRALALLDALDEQWFAAA